MRLTQIIGLQMQPEHFEPTHEEMMTHRVEDHRLTEEGLILEGLAQAVHKGWLTETDKADWLSDYIDRRNAVI